MEQHEAVRGVENLSRANEDGLETLLIRGRWSKKGSVGRRSQAAKTLRSLSAGQKYLLKRPEVVGEKLRVSIEGKESEIRKLLARIDRLKVPYVSPNFFAESTEPYIAGRVPVVLPKNVALDCWRN